MIGATTKPQKYNITPQIHKKIKELYQTPGNRGEVKKYAESINMPSWKLSRYAMRQGWRKKMKKTIPWTEKEKDFLRKHARYCSAVLQRKMKKAGFDRTECAIVIQRKRTHVIRYVEGHTARDVGDCLGVDIHFILRAIKLKQLKASRRNGERSKIERDHWYILDKDIKEYIMNYLDEINIGAADKYWLCDLLAGGDYGYQYT